MKKVIIAGSRRYTDKLKVYLYSALVIQKYANSTEKVEIVSGHAPGADRIGEMFAELSEYPLSLFPAKWQDLTVDNCKIANGKSGPYNVLAGFNRNQQMADYADVLIAFPSGKSSGTYDMISRAKKAGLDVWVITEKTTVDNLKQEE